MWREGGETEIRQAEGLAEGAERRVADDVLLASLFPFLPAPLPSCFPPPFADFRKVECKARIKLEGRNHRSRCGSKWAGKEERSN